MTILVRLQADQSLTYQTLKCSGCRTGNQRLVALIKLAIDVLPNMTSYDSDSSLDDQTDYAETSVLLGYASKETTDDAISHLGGTPVRGSHSFYWFRISADQNAHRHG